MLFSKLIESINETINGTHDPEISAITYDSRKVVPGALFVCIRGDNFDGHKFIGDAVTNGADAIIADDVTAIDILKSNFPVVIVPDTRVALPILANQFFDYPSRKLKLVGVTGTKGKTTITYLLDAIFKQAGFGSGVIGTMGTRINGKPVPSNRTTPESVDLQELFSRMISDGVSAVAMEVSSHALIKHRTEGTEFDVAVYTNLTHEHLDFHNTLDEYFDAKMILFKEYPPKSAKKFSAVVNIDDPRGEMVCSLTEGSAITYGINNSADISASNIIANAGGVSFDVTYWQGEFHVNMNLGGMFNVYNSLAAIGASIALGIGTDDIKAGLESIASVDGRFEAVKCGQDFDVIVDYAHTPDSLDNVLKSAKEISTGHLIVVFGCGGNRDRTKRPVMGRIAGDMADICIVTSDNPRKEDPDSIIAEIMAGVELCKGSIIETVTDRRDAIRRAIDLAETGDMVVIAGKGHETYQEFADHTIHFDDREVVREILCDIGNGSV
ncbi:MAG: UDP-N-acetylmuramoyl-L-alanyl-D-glutamate--2,6-diaminopimelate ligase [Armatimonadota bacterium]